jgi:hypothetical protein
LKKKEFHILLKNYTALTHEEGKLLILLEKEFPYSQVVHCLAARATQDNLMPEKEEQLHLAAIYTTDRSVFKAIMTVPIRERKIIDESEAFDHDEIEGIAPPRFTETESDKIVAEEKEISELLPPTERFKTEVAYRSVSSIIDDSFYDEIQHDLERLKELKHEFEETVRHLESGTLTSAAEDATSEKKKRLIDPTDELLTEIKSSKKKVTLEGHKQKEQIEIIDQFIKTQPTIKGKVPGEEKTLVKDDLAENNLIYNENIISETLAEILIKQGKKEKAIDVLKKLIWKFPQKKAYFAAQIEDLKK